MSVTVTYQIDSLDISISKTIVDWVSDADGAASGLVALDGEMLRVVTDPDGDDAPTDDYDITLVGPAGDVADALYGYGANRDTANIETVVPYIKEVITADVQTALTLVALQGTYTFTVAAAGVTKAGRCTFFLRQR